jgi:hypothetical protein
MSVFVLFHTLQQNSQLRHKEKYQNPGRTVILRFKEMEKSIQGFGGGTSRQKATLEIRPKWEDNIKMDLLNVGCEGNDWIELAQDRDRCSPIVNAVINLRVP